MLQPKRILVYIYIYIYSWSVYAVDAVINALWSFFSVIASTVIFAQSMEHYNE